MRESNTATAASRVPVVEREAIPSDIQMALGEIRVRIGFRSATTRSSTART